MDAAPLGAAYAWVLVGVYPAAALALPRGAAGAAGLFDAALLGDAAEEEGAAGAAGAPSPEVKREKNRLAWDSLLGGGGGGGGGGGVGGCLPAGAGAIKLEVDVAAMAADSTGDSDDTANPPADSGKTLGLALPPSSARAPRRRPSSASPRGRSITRRSTRRRPRPPRWAAAAAAAAPPPWTGRSSPAATAASSGGGAMVGAPHAHMDYGVPRSSLREVLRSSGVPQRVQHTIYEWWLSKRRRDPEQLPLLNRLRMEALNLRAKQARLTSTQEDVRGVRTHLLRLRKLLSLVRRREKLKAQISGLQQAYFEAQVKIRKQLSGVGVGVGGGGGGGGRASSSAARCQDG